MCLFIADFVNLTQESLVGYYLHDDNNLLLFGLLQQPLSLETIYFGAEFSSRKMSSIQGGAERWPDPDKSTGRLVRLRDRNDPRKWWKAIGPAREMMLELSPQIQHLISIEAKSSSLRPGMGILAEISFGMWMRGETPETTQLVIVFSSKSVDWLVGVAELLKESQLLKKYPRIKFMMSDKLPNEWVEVSSLSRKATLKSKEILRGLSILPASERLNPIQHESVVIVREAISLILILNHFPPHTEGDLMELATNVQYLPLLISEILAHVKDWSVSIPELLAEIRSNRTSLSELGAKDTLPRNEALNSIQSTLKPLLDILSRTSPAAVDLLRMMSFANSQSVLRSLLQGEEDDLSFLEKITLLIQCSLIQSEADHTLFKMHRLVQRCLRRWSEEDSSLPPLDASRLERILAYKRTSLEEKEHLGKEETHLEMENNSQEEQSSVIGPSSSIQNSSGFPTGSSSKTSFMEEIGFENNKVRGGPPFELSSLYDKHLQPDYPRDHNTSDDIQSLASDKDDIQSRAEHTRSSHVVTADVLLTNLFVENQQLRPLYDEALNKVGRDRFIENFRRLLKRWYLDLSLVAKTESEKTTIQLLRSRWRRRGIAQRLADIYQPQSEETHAEWDRHVTRVQEEGLSKVENWLADNNEKPLSKPEDSHFSSDEDGGDGEIDVDMSTMPHITAMEKFLLESHAFHSLVTRFKVFLLPRTLHSLVQVILTIPSDRIFFSKSEDSSVSNKMKIWLEGITQENWNWWPLRPKMRRLEEN